MANISVRKKSTCLQSVQILTKCFFMLVSKSSRISSEAEFSAEIVSIMCLLTGLNMILGPSLGRVLTQVQAINQSSPMRYSWEIQSLIHLHSLGWGWRPETLNTKLKCPKIVKFSFQNIYCFCSWQMPLPFDFSQLSAVKFSDAQGGLKSFSVRQAKLPWKPFCEKKWLQ